uniref:Sphingomyelin phosphodiesterase 2 n=1 Tax=Scophthalmus maximus TaxID=52904 RepID=A0A8D3A9B4_SCOMX
MANAESVRVRVFNLNCWGIRYLSKHCGQRYAMIGDMLCKEEHDIVLLQEVWSEKDYLSLKKKLACSHPHSHYFKSGVIGSGLALFSKHRIHDTFLYRYSLNGYPYMAHHGDWFGGKAVGMAVLSIGSLTANVYVTHLHAEYCRDKDAYLPHRVVQAWELQQFVRHTSAGADVVILGGDLNMHPQDLGNRLLRSYTGLRDSYLETDQFDGCEDGITLIADNPFISKKELIPFEKGIRIDYILFKGSPKTDIFCDSMSTTKGSVRDHPFPYSDHEALTSELRLESHTPPGTGRDERSKDQDTATGIVVGRHASDHGSGKVTVSSLEIQKIIFMLRETSFSTQILTNTIKTCTTETHNEQQKISTELRPDIFCLVTKASGDCPSRTSEQQ